MNWFDNVSSDSDHLIAPARLLEGHWRHRLHPAADPVLCRVVLDAAAPRIVAAQLIEHGQAEDLGPSILEDLAHTMLALEVHRYPSGWGFKACAVLPAWARPTFSDDQITELERIEGYLMEASEDQFEAVLELRDEFMRNIGVTDLHLYKAARQPQPQQAGSRRGGRRLVS